MSVMADRRHRTRHLAMDPLWPEEDRPLTVDDLLRQPDEGVRFELVDGILNVTPSAYNNHQFVMTRLTIVLGSWCPEDLDVLAGPGINLAEDLHRIPDLTVVRPTPLEPRFITRPPLLAIEIASRSTRTVDRTAKKRDYAEFGIELYWIVVPDQQRPSLTAYELRGKKYEQVAMVAGEAPYDADRPFPVRIVPGLLVADGNGWRSMIR